MKHITLTQKEKLLRDKIALPSKAEYAWYPNVDEDLKDLLTAALNKILLDALNEANSRSLTHGEIVQLTYRPLAELQKRYASVGICDSEVYHAIARFWSLNYDPSIYDLVRFPPRRLIETERFP